MKKIILLLMICICSVTVFAADKNITIYSFMAYNSGSTTPVSEDWDDDLLSVNPGQTLELQTQFENEWTGTIDVYMEGILSLNADITRYKTVTIEADRKKSLVLSYTIPTDTREGTYPLDVFYQYYTNDSGNKTKVTKSFDVKVTKDKLTQNDFFENLTTQLVSQQNNNNRIQDILMNYTRISDQKAACDKELGACQVNQTNNEDYKKKYETVNAQYISKVEELSSCNVQKANLHTEGDLSQAEQRARNER
jgi:hypothetical protein